MLKRFTALLLSTFAMTSINSANAENDKQQCSTQGSNAKMMTTQREPIDRWTEKQANDWYRHFNWIVGANFLPANAINQLEMWQADTFDPKEIDKELGWAQSLGMTTMRVFLHDLLWQQDAAGFQDRLKTFLSIADKHHIKPMLVLFDSCWDPDPALGPQRAPTPGVHNSGWVQSPGRVALQSPAEKQRLESYVKGIIGAFANDPRILAWDVWNEPDNPNESSYGSKEKYGKVGYVDALLPQVFAWARSAHPSQPLTSGIWNGNWSSEETLSPTEKIQLAASDVISFHNYGDPADFEKRVSYLERYGRPLFCTEYMARPFGSTFGAILPIAKKHNVAMINWGFVAGKSQTNMPWDSWQTPYAEKPPKLWFHDIFNPDGTPYREEEVETFKRLVKAPDSVQNASSTEVVR